MNTSGGSVGKQQNMSRRLLSLQTVEGTFGTGKVLANYMGVDLGGADIVMAQQLLNGANVPSLLQQMRGK